MSETQQVNPNGTGVYRAKFQVTGTVKVGPRVVSSTLPGEIKDLASFKINVIHDVLVKDGKLYGGKEAFNQIHEAVRKVFVDGSYTDLDGVICDFSEPRSPWWIEIAQIDWQLLKYVAPFEEPVKEDSLANPGAKIYSVEILN